MFAFLALLQAPASEALALEDAPTLEVEGERVDGCIWEAGRRRVHPLFKLRSSFQKELRESVGLIASLGGGGLEEDA